jgi:LPS O-antigen subunit length determinant protein (WzzB/FepE family)
MRYQGTAVQIYDMPSPSGPDARINRRMALLVSTIGLIGLVVLLGFLLLGIVSQRL